MLVKKCAVALIIFQLAACSHANDTIVVSDKFAVTYKIDWWPYQDKLNVKSIHVDLIKDKGLNLFNNTAKTRVTIIRSCNCNGRQS